jgi:hypothetical protein
MKKSLLGLLIALIAFFCGILTVGIFRIEEIPMPNPLFEKEVINTSLSKTPPINETEDVEVVEDATTQNINAWYSLDDYKKMPEVEMIKLWVSYFYEDGILTKNPDINAGIYTRLSEDIDEGFAEAIWTKIGDNRISFKTKKLKGIEYRFEGNFFKNKAMGKYEEKLLRGTLQKFLKGKKVAEVSGDFAYSEPYCLH